jgi:hypothetical protein
MLSPSTLLIASLCLGALVGLHIGLIIYALISAKASGVQAAARSRTQGHAAEPAVTIPAEAISQAIAKQAWDAGENRCGYGLQLADGRRVLAAHYKYVVAWARDDIRVLEQLDLIVCCHPGRVAKQYPSLAGRLCGDWDTVTYAGVDPETGDFNVYRGL